jgi:ADP-heptose:LPS heptosyltransferase
VDVRVGVLRLGRLGDLVMTLPALSWLSATPNVRPVLVTDERWRPLFPGIDTCAPDPGPGPVDFWLDLHGVPASRRVLRRLRGGSGVAATRKESFRRRGLLFGLPWTPHKTWPERHLDAAQRLLVRSGEAASTRPDSVPRLVPSGEPEAALLGLVPGAAHASKRWPIERFVELCQRWQGPVRAFVGPDEEDLAAPLAAAGAELWPVPLDRLRDGLSACAVVVAGDTGPLHVAGALGRPVVALFGPTPLDAGFWVWGERGVALVPDIGCAPCSLHGGPTCPKAHHRCLRDLPVERVLAAAEGLAS